MAVIYLRRPRGCWPCSFETVQELFRCHRKTLWMFWGGVRSTSSNYSTWHVYLISNEFSWQSVRRRWLFCNQYCTGHRCTWDCWRDSSLILLRARVRTTEHVIIQCWLRRSDGVQISHCEFYFMMNTEQWTYPWWIMSGFKLGQYIVSDIPTLDIQTLSLLIGCLLLQV